MCLCEFFVYSTPIPHPFVCTTQKNLKKNMAFCNFSAFDDVKQTKINQIKKRQKHEKGIVVDDKRTGADIV